MKTIDTLADLVERLGGVPLDRIRYRPRPGTATVQDVLDVERREGIACELVEGVLVEKPMGLIESRLAVWLASLLTQFIVPRNLGIVTGEQGTMQIMPDLVRIPDVAFTSWERLPGRRQPAEPVPLLAPDLAVEVLSASNTPGEMTRKREDYFQAGVRLVWEIDPDARTVAVYTAPVSPVQTLSEVETLDGGAVLPGFALPLAQLFGELDRQG
jgi:Uma2 family endonuclease